MATYNWDVRPRRYSSPLREGMWISKEKNLRTTIKMQDRAETHCPLDMSAVGQLNVHSDQLVLL